jgi:hypothetical protein
MSVGLLSKLNTIIEILPAPDEEYNMYVIEHRLGQGTSGSLRDTWRMVPTKCNAKLCTLQQQEGRKEEEPCRFGRSKRVLAWH